MTIDDKDINPCMQSYLDSQRQKLQALQQEMKSIEKSFAWRLMKPWHHVKDAWRKRRAGRHLKKRGVQ